MPGEMADPVSIEFEVRSNGWADLRLRAAGQSLSLGVSYLSDPLGDLVRLALLAVTGALDGAVVLEGEPVEWRVEFVAHASPGPGNPGLLQLAVLEHREGASHATEGKKIFRADYPTLNLARQILSAAKTQRVAYVRSWGREACPPVAISALEGASAFHGG